MLSLRWWFRPLVTEEQPDTAKELKQLQGTWRIVALEVDGKPQPAEKSPKEIIIAGDKLDGLGPEMILKIDATKKPKWADLTFKKGDKEFPIRAIYELDGDNFKLCFSMAKAGKAFENKRPEGFDTAGKGTALFLAMRMKKT